MSETEFEKMKREAEDEKYLEWEMRQPGYWRDRALIAIASIMVFLMVGAVLL